jgi:hypothetical protein
MDAALAGALGGEEPKRRMTREEMREYILSAPENPKSYDDFGRFAAKMVFEFLERHPEAATMPADSKHEWPVKADGSFDWNAKPKIVVEGLYEYIKRTEPGNAALLSDAGMTGFMWGWAVNAARSCLDLPPVHNPAIVTIAVKEAADDWPRRVNGQLEDL